MGVQRSASHPRSNKNSSQTRSFWTWRGKRHAYKDTHTHILIHARREQLASHYLVMSLFLCVVYHLCPGSSQSFQREKDARQDGQHLQNSFWTEGTHTHKNSNKHTRIEVVSNLFVLECSFSSISSHLPPLCLSHPDMEGQYQV